ncbi:MAG: hypothetical protein ACREQV_08885 [Candidatus Binatia bacterium]
MRYYTKTLNSSKTCAGRPAGEATVHCQRRKIVIGATIEPKADNLPRLAAAEKEIFELEIGKSFSRNGVTFRYGGINKVDPTTCSLVINVERLNGSASEFHHVPYTRCGRKFMSLSLESLYVLKVYGNTNAAQCFHILAFSPTTIKLLPLSDAT